MSALCQSRRCTATKRVALDTVRSTVGFSQTNRSVTRAARWGYPVPLQMLGVKFEYAEWVYESVGHSQPRGRRGDCISGVCVRGRPGARREGQMDRKDSHYTCGQGRALAERPWNLGPPGPAREGPSVRHQGTGRQPLLGRDGDLGRRGEDRRTVHRRAYRQGLQELRLRRYRRLLERTTRRRRHALVLLHAHPQQGLRGPLLAGQASALTRDTLRLLTASW